MPPNDNFQSHTILVETVAFQREKNIKKNYAIERKTPNRTFQSQMPVFY
jgi:hypothetical protein